MSRENNAIADVSKWVAAISCSATPVKERHFQSLLSQETRLADRAREAISLPNAAPILER